MFDDSSSDEATIERDEPPRRRRRRASPRRRFVVATPLRYADIGPMPVNDPLAMNAWVHRALGVSASQVVVDPNLTDEQRRNELCSIATRMAALTDQSRIYTAERTVLGDHAKVNSLTGDGPQMEPDDGQEPEVSEASSGGAPRRGRPRKRSLS